MNFLFQIKIKTILLIPFLWSVIAFSQNDSTRIFYSWEISEISQNYDYIFIDTLINDFHKYDVSKNSSISSTNLGSPGLAIESNIFSKQINCPFVFINAYFLYSYNQLNNIYFNTRKHYTNVTFVSNTDKTYSEQDINVIHTQNINRYVNFGFRYNLISAKGQFKNQNAINNSISFFSSYRKKNNSLFATYNYNKFKISDNGGIVNDTVFTNAPAGIPLLNIPVNLDNAKSNLVFKNFSLTYKHDFYKNKTDSLENSDNSIGSFTYNINGNQFRKLYWDDISAYYYNYYFDTLTTYDSTQLGLFSNNIKFTLNELDNFPLKFNLSIAYIVELIDYHVFLHRFSEFSNGLNFSIYNTNKKIDWSYSAEYMFNGYRQNDLELKLNLIKNFREKSLSKIVFKAEFSKQNPFVSENMFYSNNFIWDTLFLMKDKTNIDLKYLNEKYLLSAGLNLSILDNFIYFDEFALPRQTNSTFNVLSLFAGKKLNFKAFHFSNTVFYQKTANATPVRLPEVCFMNSTYFDFCLLKKLLYIKIGFDVSYFTEFYADAYMPSTGVFYLQNQKQTGNYPFTDFFTCIKLKRARFFLKFEHVNSGMSGKEYFTAFHYPLHERIFKFGISWNFYD